MPVLRLRATVSSTKACFFKATSLVSPQSFLSLFFTSNLTTQSAFSQLLLKSLPVRSPFPAYPTHVVRRTVAKLFRRSGGAGGADDEQREHGLQQQLDLTTGRAERRRRRRRRHRQQRKGVTARERQWGETVKAALAPGGSADRR